MALSISGSELNLPRLKRIAEWANSLSLPNAFITCEGFKLALLHAEPVEQATPRIFIIILSAFNPGKQILRLCANLL